MKKLILFFLLLFTSQMVFSQAKYAHLNYGTLLSVVPETKVADQKLEAYQNQLTEELQTAIEAYKSRYLEINEEVNSGGASPKKIKEYEAELANTENVLKFQEIQMKEKIANKRQELLGPIIEKVNAAIEAVAKERGILMVFDTSIFNAILAADEEADLMPFVLAKLGIDYNK